jgi:hypothetical protein
MEKIKHFFHSFLPLAALMVLLIAGCTKDKLRLAVDGLNKQCPMDIGLSVRMMGASYDGDRITVRYMLDERLIKIDAMRSNEELLKKQLLATYSNGENNLKKFVDTILEVQATMEFIYEGSLSGKQFSLIVSPEELKEAQSGMILTPDESLAAMLQIVNAQTPLNITDEIVMTAMIQEGDGVYYLYEVSDPSVFANIQANTDEMKAEVRQNLENLSDVEKTDLRRIPAANKFLGYRYISKATGQSVEFTYTKSQLSDILR